MKKHSLKSVVFAFCLAAAFACAKEDIKESERSSKGESFVIEACFAGNDNATRTVLDSAAILWAPGDKIMVYQGELASGEFTSVAKENCAKTSFSGSLSVIIGEQENNPGEKALWGVYPSASALGCDGNSVTIKVNAGQQGQEGTFAPGVFPSVARSNSYMMAFYNVCGGLRFTVAQNGIRKVVLKGADSEVLAGNATVSFAEGSPSVSSVSSPVDSIVVNAPDSNGFIPGKHYFIVSLPASLAKGYSMSYGNEYGATVFSSAKAVEIKRNTFANVFDKDCCGILFRDQVAKAACVAAFDTDRDGELSFDEAKAATTLEGLFEDYDGVQYFPELKYFTSVTDLKGCFTECVNMKEIEIPSFITALGEKSFYGCTSLREMELPSNVKTIGEEAFRNCTSLASVTISEGVESIGTRAFYNTAVSQITLPASVKSIGNRSFGNETEEIIMTGTVPPSLASVSFGTSTKFYVPDAALTTYKTADGWEEFEEYIFPVSEYYRDLSKDGTANCYIVSKAGTYKFKAVQGNSSASVGDVKGVKVLWESFGTDVTPSVGDLIQPDVSYKDNYITFSTNRTYKEGNAVIAAYGDAGCSDGNVLWSWHIWLCKDFNPAATAQVYNNSAGTMMDRNLGATSAAKGDVKALGLLYQWGRKDPFLSGNTISSYDGVAASTLSWPLAVSSNSSNGTIAYAVSHPTTFITYNSNNYDWYYTGSSSTDNTRWQTSDKTKGVYDPCPAGWRVPDGGSSGVWSKAFGSSSWYENGPWDSTNNGMDFGSGNGKSSSMQLGAAHSIWYPAAGYRYNDFGSLINVGDFGYYWSCTPGSYDAYRLGFSYDGRVNPSNGYLRALGQSVRCLSE